MSFRFTIKNPGLDDEQIIELSGEAMVSIRPPLSEEAMVQIAEIKEARLAALNGADKFQALKCFEILGRLPPIEGPRAAKLLSAFSKTDFPIPTNLEEGIRQFLPSAKEPKTLPNEWGYVTEVARNEDNSIEFQLPIDRLRAARDGIQVTAEMYFALSQVSDREIRASLIEDCCKIVRLRLDLDLSQ